MSRTGCTEIRRAKWPRLGLTCIRTFAGLKEAAKMNTFSRFERCLVHHKHHHWTSGRWKSMHSAVILTVRAFSFRRSINRLHNTQAQIRSTSSQMCLCSKGEFIRPCRDKKTRIHNRAAPDHRCFHRTVVNHQACRGDSSMAFWRHRRSVFQYSRSFSLSKCSRCQFALGQGLGLPLSCQILGKLDQISIVRHESFARRRISFLILLESVSYWRSPYPLTFWNVTNLSRINIYI